jgi:hypothetical protein
MLPESAPHQIPTASTTPPDEAYDWFEVMKWALLGEAIGRLEDILAASYFAGSPRLNPLHDHDFRDRKLIAFCLGKYGSPETFAAVLTGHFEDTAPHGTLFWIDYSEVQRSVLSRYGSIRSDIDRSKLVNPLKEL